MLAPLLMLASFPQQATSQVRENKGLEGSWAGDFGAGNWTFKFTAAGGSWAGQYTYPQYKGWNPVLNLAVAGKNLRFSLKAKTAVDFDLKMDGSRNALVGTVKFAHGMTPTSAPVILPVTLKRI
ncbi:MAG: hypothetical protein ACJ8EB_12050 [Allosphingosinicella sp.]